MPVVNKCALQLLCAAFFGLSMRDSSGCQLSGSVAILVYCLHFIALLDEIVCVNIDGVMLPWVFCVAGCIVGSGALQRLPVRL